MEGNSIDLYTLGSLLDRAFTTTSNNLGRKLKEAGYDITPSQFVILKKLYDEDGLTQKKLTALIRKDCAAINRAVNILINKGFIVKGEDFKIKNNLFLTPLALTYKEKILEVEKQVIDDCLNGIPESRRIIGLRFLNKIYKNCTNHSN